MSDTTARPASEPRVHRTIEELLVASQKLREESARLMAQADELTRRADEIKAMLRPDAGPRPPQG